MQQIAQGYARPHRDGLRRRRQGKETARQAADHHEPDDYGDTMFTRYTRTCVVCGKEISKEDIKEEDVVVKEENGFPRRLVYHKMNY